MDKTRSTLFQVSLVTGFATAVGMWSVWYILHLPGISVQGEIAGAILGAILVIGCSVGALGSRTRLEGAIIGGCSGFVSGLINLLLLGSKVVVQPASTADMAEKANELRPDAPLIVLGFLAASVVAGGFAGLIGPKKSRSSVSEVLWIGRFAIVFAFSILPLVVAGGIVTSTDSGMAVPDSVTTYGSISVLFPLSLMAEPRVFFEHTHRLFGTLVGLTAVVLAIWSMVRWRAWGAFGFSLAGVVVMGIALAGEMRDQIPTWAGVGVVIAVSAVCLILTARAILADRFGAVGVGLLVLVVGQGLLGALRVSEISTPLAMVHGVFAQLVFASAAAFAAGVRSANLPEEPNLSGKALRSLNQCSGFAKWALWALVFQLILGAGYRHTASHAFLGGHVLLALGVATMVVLVGLSLGRVDRTSSTGRWAKRRGKGLTHMVIAQVALGIIAVIFVTTRDAGRPIPTSAELEQAGPLPRTEAVFTTAHQATGAGLLALVAATMIRTRRYPEPAEE